MIGILVITDIDVILFSSGCVAHVFGVGENSIFAHEIIFYTIYIA